MIVGALWIGAGVLMAILQAGTGDSPRRRGIVVMLLPIAYGIRRILLAQRT